MDKFLGDLDLKYASDLKASIETYDDYDTVSMETLNDYQKVARVIELLVFLGYLDDYEGKEITNVAKEIRLIALKELEREQKV